MAAREDKVFSQAPCRIRYARNDFEKPHHMAGVGNRCIIFEAF